MSRKPVADSFIYFQERANGRKYARFCPSDRKHGGKDIYLGVVIDEVKGVFHNRNSGGYFRFTIEAGRQELTADERSRYGVAEKGHGRDTPKMPLTLNFGDAWFLDHIVEVSGLRGVLGNVCPGDLDTLLALIAFRLLETGADCHAGRWLESSYARYLYPKAQIGPQRISEFLVRLGAEETQRSFFGAYLAYLRKTSGLGENVLIDYAGLPGDIHFERSKACAHDGVSRKARLFCVVERGTGLPVYFRYVAGRAVDASTLLATVNGLKAQGIDVEHGILDAGYCSQANVKMLKKDDISFLTGLPCGRFANDLIARHGGDLLSHEYEQEHGDRVLRVKRVPARIFGLDLQAYICLDVDLMRDEQQRSLQRSISDSKKKTRKDTTEDGPKRLGYFVLLSSKVLSEREVLPLRYMRQTVGRIFDLAKNDAGQVPPMARDDETLRGHLMLCFMSAVALMTVKRLLDMRKRLKDMDAKMALRDMSSIKCGIFDKILVMTEANKYANTIIKELKLEMPGVVNI
ncbi:MAG: transposase [Deltaproteobacteria bacterium]|jgi:hypothetical protein|nr:transposase [Deltaproteobacteria bacterium]